MIDLRLENELVKIKNFQKILKKGLTDREKYGIIVNVEGK